MGGVGTLTSHLAATIEKVNNALEWFKYKCMTTTGTSPRGGQAATTPRDGQYSAPTDLDEALIEGLSSSIGDEEGGNKNGTSAEAHGDGDLTTTSNSAVLRFYDLDVLSEV